MKANHKNPRTSAELLADFCKGNMTRKFVDGLAAALYVAINDRYYMMAADEEQIKEMTHLALELEGICDQMKGKEAQL